MPDPAFNWPKSGNRAFEPSVSADVRDRIEAFVMPTDEVYLAGFQRAADMIVDAASHEDLNSDDLFFPVAYMYRHHLELMLKELVRLGVRIGILHDCEEILGKHNLHALWHKAKDMIDSVWPDSPADDVQAAEKVILEIHKLDPRSQNFRYARDTSGNPVLRDGPKRIDLQNLKWVVDAVSNFLDAAYAGIDASDPGPG